MRNTIRIQCDEYKYVSLFLSTLSCHVDAEFREKMFPETGETWKAKGIRSRKDDRG